LMKKKADEAADLLKSIEKLEDKIADRI
jgi:hypothetical protein